MSYAHTNLAIDNRLDIVSKYKELVDLTSNGKKICM